MQSAAESSASCMAVYFRGEVDQTVRAPLAMGLITIFLQSDVAVTIFPHISEATI